MGVALVFPREALGVVLHKDSKWYQQWKDFRDNNVVFNRECPHLRTAQWRGSERHSLSTPGGRAPDRGGDWGPSRPVTVASHPACEQRSAGLRRPEGKHPGRLGRQALCRRGWVTILTRTSVVVRQAGVSAPHNPPMPTPMVQLWIWPLHTPPHKPGTSSRPSVLCPVWGTWLPLC